MFIGWDFQQWQSKMFSLKVLAIVMVRGEVHGVEKSYSL